MSEETISQLLVLAKLAYDGTKEDQLIFHEIGGALETLGRKGCGLFVSIVTTFKVWSVCTCTILYEVCCISVVYGAKLLPIAKRLGLCPRPQWENLHRTYIGYPLPHTSPHKGTPKS